MRHKVAEPLSVQLPYSTVSCLNKGKSKPTNEKAILGEIFLIIAHIGIVVKGGQLILVHVMGAPGREASKTEPQWCDSDDIHNAWQLRSSMHQYRAEIYKMSH